MRRVIVTLLALTAPAHAQAVAFTYNQWERLAIGLKELYVAGAVDSLSTIAVPTQAGTAKYYNECLVKKEITAHNLAEEMKVIVQTRPDLRPKPATAALLASLIKLCGLPAPEWPSTTK